LPKKNAEGFRSQPGRAKKLVFGKNVAKRVNVEYVINYKYQNNLACRHNFLDSASSQAQQDSVAFWSIIIQPSAPSACPVTRKLSLRMDTYTDLQ